MTTCYKVRDQDAKDETMKSKFLQKLRGAKVLLPGWTGMERGDTLIEVVFALGILSVVLTGSIGIAAKAFQAGQTARERTQLADEAQQQLEVLRAFRDNHSWQEFLYGSSVAGTYPGVLFFGGPAGCIGPAPCFHMVLANHGSTTEYVPAAGGLPIGALSVPTSYIEISANSPGGSPPNLVDFTITYGFEHIGGGAPNTGHIKTRLANLKAP